MNRDLPRRERLAFLVEERKAAADARKAAAVVTDNQAVALVNLAATAGIKLSPAGAQVSLTLASSTIPMAVKFLCLGFGFFLFGSRAIKAAADKKTHDGSGGSGGSGSSEPRKPTLVHPEPPKPAAARTAQAGSADPHKVSSSGSRVLPGLPTAKLSAFDRAYELAVAHPHWSTRQIADRAACSQSTGQRVKKKVRGKADAIIRRYAGNGGGMHPAYN